MSLETEEQRSLWIGDVDVTMNEAVLASAFPPGSEVVGAKVIRDRATGLPAGYGFVEFASRAAAMRALELWNGKPMPGTFGKHFRLNYATRGGSASASSAVSAVSAVQQLQQISSATAGDIEHGAFVSGLSADVTEQQLLAAFAARGYPSLRAAKIATDPATGASRGFGFVRFGDENDRNRAIAEMQGALLGSKTIRTSTAQPRRNLGTPDGTPISALSAAGAMAPATAAAAVATTTTAAADDTNTTIYVGSLDQLVNEEYLRQAFAPFGSVVSTKILPGKGCGFVTFVARQSAEAAFAMNGQLVGSQPVRISWGKGSNPRPSLPAAGGVPLGMPMMPMMMNPAQFGITDPNAMMLFFQQQQQAFLMQQQQAAAAAAAAAATASSSGAAAAATAVPHTVAPVASAPVSPLPVSTPAHSQAVHADDLSRPVPAQQLNAAFVTETRVQALSIPTLSRAAFGMPPVSPLFSS